MVYENINIINILPYTKPEVLGIAEIFNKNCKKSEVYICRESSEERIISSFNFDKYQFNCITIERPTKLVNEILFKNGYEFVKNFRFDSFYVHSDIKKKYNIKGDPFEQIPAKDW